VLRKNFGDDFIVVTPGIRPAGAAVNDQQRIATPVSALQAGADYLVIGRPIRDADNPEAMIDAIMKDIE
jgi:orotidine-5'-phosphate decarboxylase